MIVINQNKDIIIADQLRKANNFLERLVGLLNRKDLQPGEALLINPCQMVHTFFMKFNIDLIFLNEEDLVVKIVSNFPPNRISPFVDSASKVIELKASSSLIEKIEVGDRVVYLSESLYNKK
jgi:hypothetical protein